MTVRQLSEYLISQGCLSLFDSFTFVVTNADDYSKETSIRTLEEWQTSQVMDYVVLNKKQPVTYWLSGVNWNTQIENGNLNSWLVISRAEFEKKFRCEEQRTHLEKYIADRLV